jgi:hypothetical protein
MLQGGLREVLARQRVALEGARLLVLNASHALDRYTCESLGAWGGCFIWGGGGGRTVSRQAKRQAVCLARCVQALRLCAATYPLRLG